MERTHVGTVRGANMADTMLSVLGSLGYPVKVENVEGTDCWDVWVMDAIAGEDYCTATGMVAGIAATVRRLERKV